MDLLQVWQDALPVLLVGAKLTIQLTVLAVFFGSIIGLFLGLGKLSRNPVIKMISVIYVEFFRGSPLLVQIFLFYFGLSQVLGHPVDKFWSSVAVLSLNSGAYCAEIFRAGIQSIERGQMEAARSLGMTHSQAMRYVILPQAFKRVIPPLGNEFIAMLKDTSLVSIIGLVELARSGQLIVSTTYKAFEVWFLVAIVYIIMTVLISQCFVNRMERRLQAGDHS
ncbi:amino acid ABC transporter permease [Desulforamulus hydrothermalis]|uniref:Putative transporter subunit: permease component of ABC superfamily transporter n=1 Tax=Desulforamulus hydrothermalis Lam5 = DSM 18033 TaxID=1121428 RepID=K8E003_9FIRM|nr:amino acid ABC transporter permease [Desulforamulus hydrothermalis]CCO08779.1 putative transporter subunit: permease component of ABC superfamily transporter [Desulforamulus hydrothermalis Lam5 = DSM 18033]SHG71307.1 amino acid ABC transporter membrane protein, PAAT family [Desulforamulus hydrothermalis Lam5 = DSM 18033]